MPEPFVIGYTMTLTLAVLFVNGAGGAPPPLRRGLLCQVAIVCWAEALSIVKHVTNVKAARDRILDKDFIIIYFCGTFTHLLCNYNSLSGKKSLGVTMGLKFVSVGCRRRRI